MIGFFFERAENIDAASIFVFDGPAWIDFGHIGFAPSVFVCKYVCLSAKKVYIGNNF